MKALIMDRISGSGDSHFCTIALFTEEKKAQSFLLKCEEWADLHDSSCHFEIQDHIPENLPVDPIHIEQVLDKS